jgi:hypothetical protein
MWHEGGVKGLNNEGKRAQAMAVVREHSWQYLVKTDPVLAMAVNPNVAREYQMLKYGPDRRSDPDIVCHWFFGKGGSGKSFKAEMWLKEKGGFNCKKV